MTCSKSNFHIGDQQSYPCWAKDSECPTKEKQSQHNQPFMEAGCFWNVNHLIQGQSKVGSQQLDPVFEGQILRDHLQVVKVAMHDYVWNSNQQGGHVQDCYISPLFQADVADFKELGRLTYDFVAVLKNTPSFKEEDIRKLEEILLDNPMHLRLFLIFSEAAPSSIKTKLYYLIYKGLLLHEDSNKLQQVTSQTLYEYLENHYGRYLEGLESQKDEEKFKTLAITILYTTAMSALGVSFNRFYEKLAQKIESLEKLKLTKFQRDLNSVKQKSKKVKLVRRRTLGRIDGLEKEDQKKLDG